MVLPCRVLCRETAAIPAHFRHNEQIRISPIRLIDHEDNQVGIVPTAEGLRMAREAGLDLVEVSPTARPPVCKILDYGKWRYQQQKKESKKTSSRAGQLKEIKIKTVRIGEHDLGIKIKHALEFLAEGNKVQFTLQFRGREMAHTELGYQLFQRVTRELANACKVERPAKMEGRRMTLLLQADHRSKTAKLGEAAAPDKAAAKAAGGSSAAAAAGERLQIPPRPAAPASPAAPAAPATATN